VIPLSPGSVDTSGVAAIAAASAEDFSRDQTLWEQELERVRMMAPSLSEPARQLVGAVLESILAEAGDEPEVLDAVRSVLARLESGGEDAPGAADGRLQGPPWQRRPRIAAT
jgi:hypothetical protein